MVAPQSPMGFRLNDKAKQQAAVVAPSPPTDVPAQEPVALVIGASIEGLAVASSLHQEGVKFLMFEGADCIASAFGKRKRNIVDGTNSCLLLPYEKLSELPGMPFPTDFPEYPTEQQYVDYLERYVARFEAGRYRHPAAYADRHKNDFKVGRRVTCFSISSVELCNGCVLEIDAIIFATGYRSNMPQAQWLLDGEVSRNSGYPNTAFPQGWNGKSGLYAVGFSERGCSGDHVHVAKHISQMLKKKMKTALTAGPTNPPVARCRQASVSVVF